MSETHSVYFREALQKYYIFNNYILLYVTIFFQVISNKKIHIKSKKPQPPTLRAGVV